MGTFASVFAGGRVIATALARRPAALVADDEVATVGEGGCPFAPRCTLATVQCRAEAPPLRSAGSGSLACHHVALAA